MASNSSVRDPARRAGTPAGEGAPATRVEPVSFEGRFGVLHRPAVGPARGLAVLICAPVGRDGRCAYRPFFLLAEALAARGFPVLRYDHLGDGDSLPLDPEADQWRPWVEGVGQAAAFLRAHSGAAKLAVAGLRIGATLAALTASAVQPDALALLAPITSGKAWLRELQVAATMVGLEPAADGALEIDGLRLSRATQASLQGLDLKRSAPFSGPALLATPTPDARLAERLGSAVATAPFEGYAELFKEAHLNSPPTALFAALTAWLEGVAAGVPPARPAPAPPPAQLVGADWIERPVSFGAGLCGVLCQPIRPSAEATGVVLGNTGGDPRAGIGGFAARACRELAARGVTALRFDFAGLGESASPGAWRPHVYETSRVEDLRAAADLLAGQGCAEVVLAGVCAGGYHALRAAVEEPRFRKVMAINSWLVWRPHDPLELQRVLVPRRRRINVLALLRPSGWRRLMSGEVRAGAALATLGRRIRQRLLVRRLDLMGRWARLEIARISAAGAQLLVVVGRDDESLEGLETDFGFRGGWLARRRGVALHTVAGLDHGLFSRDSQDKALAELFRFVGLEGAPSRPRRRRRTRRLAEPSLAHGQAAI